MYQIFIAGNWKLNNSPGETEEFMKNLNKHDPSFIENNKLKAIVCPPSLSIERAVKNKPSWLSIGGQDSYFEESGAFTGETSPSMLLELGACYVIVGHSERRKLFGETNDEVNKKVNKLLELDLTPILCVGEDETEREQGITFAVIELQLKKALWGIDKEKINGIVIAYEPVWAIGTGKAATYEDAEEAGRFINDTLDKLGVSKDLPVLYGGSVNPDNITDFVSQSNIDGALVGGKSVTSDSFMKLLQKVSEIY